MPAAHVPLTDQLLAGSFPSSDPFALYAALQADHPVAWNATAGFWAITRHADVMAVATDSQTWCSSKGILVSEIGTHYDAPPTMMHTDPPDHTRYRALVQPAFSKRRMRELEGSIRSRVVALLDSMDARTATGAGAIDVVDALAVPLPIEVITDLLGIHDVGTERILQWTEAAIPDTDGLDDEERMALLGEMLGYLVETAGARRKAPEDDFISDLAAVEVDGSGLSDDELAMFLIQLLVAGNDTTRNVISGGIVALAERPEEWRRLRADPALRPTAVEELVRWTTPVISFLRTATRDTTLGGVDVAEGDPALLLYAAANRDPAEFGPTAGELDVGRTPNHHLGFGFGAHFCLGAALARMEVAVVLEELAARYAGWELAAEPQRSPSTIIAGITAAPVAFRPA